MYLHILWLEEKKKGIEYASRKVFIGANFIITPITINKKENIEKIKELAKTMGFGKISMVNPYDHDKIISFTKSVTPCYRCFINK